MTLPCIHRGRDLRNNVLCPSCAGMVRLATFACAKHDRCTLGKAVEGVACCQTCPDCQEDEPFQGPVIRDLAYHIYPRKGNGRWQWNVRQLLQRIHLFNGRRRVALVIDDTTDNPSDVLHLFGSELDRNDVIITPNDPELRETKNFITLIEPLHTAAPNRCLLYAHAKGVTKPQNDTVCRNWTEVLYESMMDYWPVVEEQLAHHPCAGSFRRMVARAWPGQSRSTWHYSGSWVWYRSARLFTRNWREIDQFWSGIEPYPSLHFNLDEAGVVFHDKTGDLYSAPMWNTTVWPEWNAWALTNARKRTGHPPPVPSWDRNQEAGSQRQPTVSVIVPTILRSSLDRTIASLRRQSWREGDEVLLMGDGCQPPELGFPFKSIHLLPGPNHDWGHTVRNHAARLARGEMLAFLDDDDEWTAGALDLVRTAQELSLFRMHVVPDNGLLWRDRVIRDGNVSTQMIVVPRVLALTGTWGHRYQGDLDFIKSLATEPVWRTECLARVWPTRDVAVTHET